MHSIARGQVSRQNLGVSMAVSNNAIVQYSPMVGNGSVKDLSSSKFGVSYTFQQHQYLGFETGFHLITQRYKLTPAFTGVPQPPKAHEFRIISLPAQVRYSFLKFLYLHGGLILDVDVKNSGGVNDQSGVGLGMGAGGEYFFKNSIGFFINPQIAQHGVVSFSDVKSPRKLAESNLTFGISYRLK